MTDPHWTPHREISPHGVACCSSRQRRYWVCPEAGLRTPAADRSGGNHHYAKLVHVSLGLWLYKLQQGSLRRPICKGVPLRFRQALLAHHGRCLECQFRRRLPRAKTAVAIYHAEVLRRI